MQYIAQLIYAISVVRNVHIKSFVFQQINKGWVLRSMICSNKKTQKKDIFKRVFRYRQLYYFLIPAIIMVFIFNYLPIYGVQIAFKDFKPVQGIWGSAWAGFKYFTKFFTSYQFSDIMINTIRISIATLLLGFPMPIILALVVNQMASKSLKFAAQSITFIPHFISNVTVVGILIVFLSPNSGIIAALVSLLGFEPLNYMGEPHLFTPIYVISEIWQHTGWDSIIYVAALSAIDGRLYEAADLDGASQFKKILYIDIPSLGPTIATILVLRTGQILNLGFEKIYLMQNSLNLSVSEVIATYVYKTGLLSAQYSYSAAIGLFNNVINFILLILVNKITQKISKVSIF